MRIIILLLFTSTCSFLQSQNLENYQLIDKFKTTGITTKVYFNDPFRYLISKYPDFNKKDNQLKYKLLSEYLHNNPLYIFQTYKKKNPDKTYWLIGNPRKLRTKNYFNVEIRNNDNSVDKILDQINLGGSFFEHMMLFQTAQGKASVGKGVQIWGYFTKIESYDIIKSKIIEIMEKDRSNSIPEEILKKEEELIEPFFEYQKCGLEKIIRRTFLITVFQYDSLGNIKNEYPRTEKDSQLYYSSTSKDLIGVTTFPYFSSSDKITTSDSVIYVDSKLENINHYLKDIKITNTLNDRPKRIEGKLIRVCL